MSGVQDDIVKSKARMLAGRAALAPLMMDVLPRIAEEGDRGAIYGETWTKAEAKRARRRERNRSNWFAEVPVKLSVDERGAALLVIGRPSRAMDRLNRDEVANAVWSVARLFWLLGLHDVDAHRGMTLDFDEELR